MKNILVAFLFCSTSTIAYAIQPFTVEKPVFCTDVKTMIEFLSGEDYQESPLWVGKDEKSKYVIMSNDKSKTWTIVQFNDQVACILGTGTNGNIVKPLNKSNSNRGVQRYAY